MVWEPESIHPEGSLLKACTGVHRICRPNTTAIITRVASTELFGWNNELILMPLWWQIFMQGDDLCLIKDIWMVTIQGQNLDMPIWLKLGHAAHTDQVSLWLCAASTCLSLSSVRDKGEEPTTMLSNANNTSGSRVSNLHYLYHYILNIFIR